MKLTIIQILQKVKRMVNSFLVKPFKQFPGYFLVFFSYFLRELMEQAIPATKL